MIDEPLPETGWSREVLHLQGATVCPAEDMDDAPGVWAGGDIPEAATWREGIRVTLPIAEPPEAEHRLSGKHLWGGIYFGHFGHFLVETISRLWAAEQEGIDSVLFTPRHGKLKDFATYQADILDLFLPNSKVQILREPTEVEGLLVAGQGFGIGNISAGTPEFRAFVQRAMQDVEPRKVEKIYISRTRFNGKGGIIDEPLLEENLIAQGYTPIFPEKLPFREQLSLFKSAKKIIGLDSSAFHVLGYVATPEQDICIVTRRNHPAYEHIAAHLRAFTGRAPTVIEAVAADWMPERQKMPNHTSWGELDGDAVKEALVGTGFISDPARWIASSPARFSGALKWAEEKSKEPLVRRDAEETLARTRKKLAKQGA